MLIRIPDGKFMVHVTVSTLPHVKLAWW